MLVNSGMPAGQLPSGVRVLIQTPAAGVVLGHGVTTAARQHHRPLTKLQPLDGLKVAADQVLSGRRPPCGTSNRHGSRSIRRSLT